MPKKITDKTKVAPKFKFRNPHAFVDEDLGVIWHHFHHSFPEQMVTLTYFDEDRIKAQRTVNFIISKEYGRPILLRNDEGKLFGFAFLNPLFDALKSKPAQKYWIHYLDNRTRMQTMTKDFIEKQWNLSRKEFIKWLSQMKKKTITRFNFKKETSKLGTEIKTRLYSQEYQREGGAPLDRLSMSMYLHKVLPDWNGNGTSPCYVDMNDYVKPPKEVIEVEKVVYTKPSKSGNRSDKKTPIDYSGVVHNFSINQTKLKPADTATNTDMVQRLIKEESKGIKRPDDSKPHV